MNDLTSLRQAEDQPTFTYFPYVGDVADKKWVDELKELYDKGESLRANDLSRTSMAASTGLTEPPRRLGESGVREAVATPHRHHRRA